jgi:hypothetical protein
VRRGGKGISRSAGDEGGDPMDLYMFLICHNPAVGLGPDDPPTLQPQHAALGEKLRGEGRYVSGGALMPYDAEAVVRVHGARRLGTDGPFAETKEVLGGYYIVECKDADDALSVASRIPVASDSWVQVRRFVLPPTEAVQAMKGD